MVSVHSVYMILVNSYKANVCMVTGAGSRVGLSLSHHLVCVNPIQPQGMLCFYCGALKRYGRPILIVLILSFIN